MPRVIVTTDPSPVPGDAATWLDEQVLSLHLSTGHAAAQFLERLAWAISDAEDAEGAPAERSPRRGEDPGRRRTSGTARRWLSAA